MDAQLVHLMTGVSSAFGLISVFGYLYFLLSAKATQSSVRRLVEDEGIFNATQVVQILEKFDDEAARLRALKVLTHYDTTKAHAFLKKVNASVDLSKIHRESTSDRRRRLGWAAVVFFVLTAASILYAYLASGEDANGISSRRIHPTDDPMLVLAGPSPAQEYETKDRMYREALQSHHRADYVRFLERFPDGTMSTDIRRRLKACTGVTDQEVFGKTIRIPAQTVRAAVASRIGTRDELLNHLAASVPVIACLDEGYERGRGACEWLAGASAQPISAESIDQYVDCTARCYSIFQRTVELERCQ